MDTSVPRQRDASDAALVDMLMLEAPVGLALFGSDLRFRWVNAALTRLNEPAGADPSAPSDPHPDPSAWAGLRPSAVWPEHVATRAETALRKVLDEGMPLAERGYPVMSPPAGGPASPAAAAASASAPAEDVCGCASWFPVASCTGNREAQPHTSSAGTETEVAAADEAGPPAGGDITG